MNTTNPALAALQILRTWNKWCDMWRCIAVNMAKSAGQRIPRIAVYR